MNFFSRLTVVGKLVTAFGAVLAVLLILGAMALHQMSQMQARTDTIMNYRLAGVRDSGRMAEAATRLRARDYRVTVSTSNEDLKVALDRRIQGIAAFDEASKAYAAFIASEEERALYNKALASWAEYLKVGETIKTAMAEGQDEEAMKIARGAVKVFDAAIDDLHALTEYNDKLAAADAKASTDTYQVARAWVLGAMLVALGLSVGLCVLIARAIAGPLRDALELAEAVASGDLTHDSHAKGHDEVAQLSRALGNMVTRLRQLVSEVRSGVLSVSTASTEIASGNLDLSQRTEEQASNLQQTAASMEELTATVKQNADTARTASQLAASASQVAVHGGEVVGQVVQTMDTITHSSRKISEIVGVIEGIAFQTNILALNAAVEAARAGEQGRGFAVVASEVRALAQRSATASKEIKVLIGESVDKVEVGAKLVADAGQTMTQIVSQVQRVTDLIGEISSASVEQSQGISQVGDAVAQLDQVTQQNAALVEESAAAAESMKHQAARLADVVSVFRLDETPHAAPSASARPAAPAVRPSAHGSGAAHPAPRPTPTASPALASSGARPGPVASVPAAAPVGGADEWESF